MNRLAFAPIFLAIVACSPSPPKIVTASTPEAEPPPLAMPAIAVLENQPAAVEGQAARFVVRMVFQNSGGGWRSVNPDCQDEACLASSAGTWPPTAMWSVVNAGSAVGTVRGRTPQAWTRYADVGIQEVANTADTPKVGPPTQEWSDAGVDLQRPLVAISTPKASDPDAWKDGVLSPQARTALQDAFMHQFTEVRNCEQAGGQMPAPLKYKPVDVVSSAVRTSSKGWTVVTAQLTGYRCDGPAEGTAFAPQAFAISPEGRVRYLGEGLKLVDSGDYDGNGQSELVYAIQRGHTGGYELYSNDFAEQATFAFNYH